MDKATVVDETDKDKGERTPKKPAPTKALPTDRISPTKQLELLRAYAAASGPTGRAVTNKEVAELVKMAESTVGLGNVFFTDTGLLLRADGGYQPAPEVISFQRAYEWNPETASQKLGPVVARSWFAQALLPRLEFRPLEQNEAIQVLAEVASAAPEYRDRLWVCLEYLVASGLVQRDGTQVRIVRGSDMPVTSPADRSAPAPPIEKDPPAGRTSVATTFAQPTEGVVQFHVSVKVDMKEFAGWAPDRIAAFFSGIAQVLAAKGSIEKDAAG